MVCLLQCPAACHPSFSATSIWGCAVPPQVAPSRWALLKRLQQASLRTAHRLLGWGSPARRARSCIALGKQHGEYLVDLS